MNRHLSLTSRTKQLGAGLLIFMILMLSIAGGTLYIANNQKSDIRIKNNQSTQQALSQAKLILENFSISFDPTLATNPAIGRLPFPDRFNGSFDGNGNCFAGTLNNNLLIGRFPWLGSTTPCSNVLINANLKDAGNNPLWYVVSKHMVEHSINTTFSPDFLDPDPLTHPGWLTIFDHNGKVISDRVAFIVFSPGNAFGTQNRSNSATNNYLDSYNVPGQGIINNAENDLRFVKAPYTQNSFNDQLVYMTIDELMPKLERRVLTELRSLLIFHQNGTAGEYPLPTTTADFSQTCDSTTAPSPGYGFIARLNSTANPCPSVLSVPIYLNAWLDYILYETRQDCVNGFTPQGCGNIVNANALTVNGTNNVDFVLISTGFHPFGAFTINTDIDDIINQTPDQIYISPTINQTINQDQLIFQ